MKNLSLILFVLLSFSISGCKSIGIGQDPIVVNAERTLSIALTTFDVFLKYEYDNRAALEQISPDIKKFADVIRRNGKNWIETANNLKIAYKHNRTEQAKVSLITALALVQSALNESQKYISNPQLQPQ